MRNIERATRVLKRIEKEFYGLKEEKGSIRFLRKFFNEGQDFGGIESTASWKNIVKEFVSLIRYMNYIQNQCDTYGAE